MSHPTRTAQHVAPRVVVTAMSLAAVTVLTLAPRALVAPARGAFMTVLERFASPVVAGMSYGELESILNALLFIPFGAALAILLSRRLWVLAPMLGFALSLGVEYAQVRIPGRVPDVHDVVWNTAGALAGAVVAGLVRLAIRPRRAQSAR